MNRSLHYVIRQLADDSGRDDIFSFPHLLISLSTIQPSPRLRPAGIHPAYAKASADRHPSSIIYITHFLFYETKKNSLIFCS